jgi:hypothetical protein
VRGVSLGRRKHIALLKEVLANEAHVCRRGTMTDKFDEVACALNNSNALPWSTNGKNCNDRFKLLLVGFRRTDRARASASGTEEDFGEKDQLLADILSAVNDNEERGRLEHEESAKRDEHLVHAGQEDLKRGVKSNSDYGFNWKLIALTSRNEER